MVQLIDIISVSKQIIDTLASSNFQIEVQNLSKARPTAQQNKEKGNQQALSILDNLIKIVTSINIGAWTSQQEDILRRLDIAQITGESGRIFLGDIKKQLQVTPSNAPAIIQKAVFELNKLKIKPSQILNTLQPFLDDTPSIIMAQNEGVVEVVFDGKVKIRDFGDAKEQMGDWYIIIEGYARLLGVRREDFEIISMSKNSPAKFKIKTTLANVTSILAIISSILVIEKTVLENKLMIEKLKQNPIVTDTTLHEEYIDKAVTEIEVKVKSEIDKIVSDKITEKGIEDGNGDVNTLLTKSVENQYNFIINGGNVNVYVTNGQVQQQVDSLEKAKIELKQIKDNYENQKSLNENGGTTNSDKN